VRRLAGLAASRRAAASYVPAAGRAVGKRGARCSRGSWREQHMRETPERNALMQTRGKRTPSIWRHAMDGWMQCGSGATQGELRAELRVAGERLWKRGRGRCCGAQAWCEPELGSRSTSGCMAHSRGLNLSSAQLVDGWMHGAVKWCECGLSAAGQRVIALRSQLVRV
jgi:hypothetical protein